MILMPLLWLVKLPALFRICYFASNREGTLFQCWQVLRWVNILLQAICKHPVLLMLQCGTDVTLWCMGVSTSLEHMCVFVVFT